MRGEKCPQDPLELERQTSSHFSVCTRQTSARWCRGSTHLELTGSGDHRADGQTSRRCSSRPDRTLHSAYQRHMCGPKEMGWSRETAVPEGGGGGSKVQSPSVCHPSEGSSVPPRPRTGRLSVSSASPREAVSVRLSRFRRPVCSRATGKKKFGQGGAP